MQIQVRRFHELTEQQLVAWSDFQQSDPALESPYFRPEFTRAVASVRDDVEVAVLRERGETVGFFPFQRRSAVLAQPVGGRLSDYQGVIGRSGVDWDPVQLLRGCGLLSWDFDHVLCSQPSFQAYWHLTDRSPYLDLTHGFDSYRDSLRRSGLNELKQTMRKARKLQREVGPLRFEPLSEDSRMLSTMIAWKSEQYRRTRVADVFAYEWSSRLLERISRESGRSFAGTLSVLYAGQKPVAIHMGMRSAAVLHWWFPAYDPQLAVYSPGRILLAELARAAGPLGIEKIDLGRGVAPYKARVMSAAVEVAEGSVDLRPLARALRKHWQRTRLWVRSSPLRGPARVPGRFVYHFREWLAMK